MAAWTAADIPDQTGRTAIVTGANTGIGYETARMLARKGARVILACRDQGKGESAVKRIQAEAPGAAVELGALDLSDLESVRRFAEGFAASNARLDLLINNAGVMVPPFSRTEQGFELQIGTNHLGHFALTGRLLPLLQATPGSRVVVVYSIAHRAGRIDLDDLIYERRRYVDWDAYSQSKLANLLFAYELQRRLAGSPAPIVAAAHPGWTATDLQRTSGLAQIFNPIFAMKPEKGALPTLRAATDPAAGPGSLWGPAGLTEVSGPPVPARIASKGRDPVVAAKLWDLSESLTGVRFGLPAASAA